MAKPKTNSRESYFLHTIHDADLPCLSFAQKFTNQVFEKTRSHLANQVRYTCDLFRYIPQGKCAQFLSSLASAAGSEEFYSLAIPIMTWCMAPFPFSRAMVMLLCCNLYVGNCLKNVFRLPRPPQEYRVGGRKNMEKSMEDRKVTLDALGFGWPSTHSCNAISLPFAVVRTYYKSLYPPPPHSAAGIAWGSVAAYAVALLYTTLVPLSRLILGVHSAADVHAGMLYGAIHLRLWLSYHDDVGAYLDEASTAFIVGLALLMIACHPRVKPLNYTFEESVCIISYTMGYIIGHHWSEHFGLQGAVLSEPDAGFLLKGGRVVAGYAVVLPIKLFIKEITTFMRSKVSELKRCCYRCIAKNVGGSSNLLFIFFSCSFYFFLTKPPFQAAGWEREEHSHIRLRHRRLRLPSFAVRYRLRRWLHFLRPCTFQVCFENLVLVVGGFGL